MDDLNKLRERVFQPTVSATQSLAHETLRVLLQYQFERSAGAYSLIATRAVWDAEIIIRTVYEASAKIMFIGAHRKPAQDDLLDEFWKTLPAIFDRKGAEKARANERVRERYDPNGDDIRIFRHLRNPEIFSIDPIGNRKLRNEIESRWSFSEIIRTLGLRSADHVQVKSLDVLLHIYGTSSHLAHASPKALDLMDDRASRGDDLIHLESGHICRMLSDLVVLGSFSLRFAASGVGDTIIPAERLNAIVHRMTDSTKDIQHSFARSQDEFYNSYDFG